MLRRNFLLGSLASLPCSAIAQNSFLTPGGASVPGIVTMCISANVAVPCTPSGGFNPTTLFTGGQTGGWWDPSDHTTTFQDTAGTTPATTAGQPVARINDKSGNGNNLLQATAGSRPTLQNSGSFWYLLCNGTPFIQAAFTHVQPITRIMTGQNITWISTAVLYDGGNNTAALLRQGETSAPNLSMFATSAFIVDPTNYTTAVDHVSTEAYNGASSSLQVDNNTAITGNPGSAAPGGLTVAATALGGAFGNIRWYGGMSIGRLLTGPETASSKTFFGAKAGLVL